MDINNTNKLMNDEKFLSALSESKNIIELQKTLRQKMKFPEKKGELFLKFLNEKLSNESQERLSDESLEELSGGRLFDKKTFVWASLLPMLAYLPLNNVLGEDPYHYANGTLNYKKIVSFLEMVADYPNRLLNEYRNIHEKLKWKLVIDGSCHDENNPLVFDIDSKGEPDEVGYLDAMLRALKFTFSDDCIKRKWNADLFLKIHNITCDNVKKINAGALCFRNPGDEAYFGLSRLGTFPNCTENGISEWHKKALSTWKSDRLVCIKTGHTDPVLGELQFDYSLLGRYSFPSDKIEYINCLINDIEIYYAPVPLNSNSIKMAVDTIFNEYYYKMDKLQKFGYVEGSLYGANVSFEDKKLEIIIRICQNLDQLHPFTDGNIRTIAFLVMNSMLIKNGLTPTIFDDPNCLDMCSVEEIKREVKKGQEVYKKLVEESYKIRNEDQL